MTRLRYPFAEIGLRCRLCNELAYMDTAGGRVGARMIDWRRQHAKVCPEWAGWAAKKGLELDPAGALLYPGETGPYVPRERPSRSGEPEPEPEEPRVDLLSLPSEAFAQSDLFG
jgi:hypothetical protein